MKLDSEPGPPSATTEARGARRNMKAAIAFGVIMATIEMGALLYFAYC